MKKLSVYYAAHAVLNFGLLFAFWDKIRLHPISLLPLALIAVAVVQLMTFRVEGKAYSESAIRLTAEEENAMLGYLKIAFLLMLPFQLPFVFFFASYWKLFCLIPYCFAYVLGGIVWRMKAGSSIRSRLNLEKKELEEQRRREELGLK